MTVFDALSPFWRDRVRASAIHLSLSGIVAAFSALLVFGLWYPALYREVSGGRELFVLVVSVDVILGPLITLAVFDRTKPWIVLRRDLMVIALLQLSALGYGLWTVAMARPVHVVFELDRFRVVHAVEVAPELLDKTPPGIVALPWTGPTLLGLRPFRDSQEKFDVTLAALQGMDLGARPDLWQTYEQSAPDVLREAKPVENLLKRFPERATEIHRMLQAHGVDASAVLYLPMVGRKSFWTVLLAPATAMPIGVLPIDSF